MKNINKITYFDIKKLLISNNINPISNLKDEDLSDVLAKRKPAKTTPPKERSARYEDFIKASDDLKN